MLIMGKETNKSGARSALQILRWERCSWSTRAMWPWEMRSALLWDGGEEGGSERDTQRAQRCIMLEKPDFYTNSLDKTCLASTSFDAFLLQTDRWSVETPQSGGQESLRLSGHDLPSLFGWFATFKIGVSECDEDILFAFSMRKKQYKVPSISTPYKCSSAIVGAIHPLARPLIPCVRSHFFQCIAGIDSHLPRSCCDNMQ